MSSLRRYKVAISIAVLLLLGTGWYFFRPEKAFENKTIDEAAPADLQGDEAKPLSTGQFSDGVHPASGTASVYKTSGGKLVLRLTGLKTSEGPDVHIVLAPANQPELRSKKPGGHLQYKEIALLKGNLGNQNYDLPADADLEHNDTVAIYCIRFSAVFGSAPLTKP